MSVMVGKPAPDFKGTAVVGGNVATLHPENVYKDISLSDYRGQWVVLFFYPEDFTFVCPTELEELARDYADFRALEAEVIAVSTDTKHSHYAWRRYELRLENLPYPMLADPTKKIAADYGVLVEQKGYALRGTFIIDPEGTVKYMVVHNEDVGRSISETLRVLEALKMGVKIPCNWTPGQATLA